MYLSDFNNPLGDKFNEFEGAGWQWVRERDCLSLPVVAMGSIPNIYLRASFSPLGDSRCIAHMRENHAL
jgi:hypothetical protein